jgi:hypothetical protein
MKLALLTALAMMTLHGAPAIGAGLPEGSALGPSELNLQLVRNRPAGGAPPVNREIVAVRNITTSSPAFESGTDVNFDSSAGSKSISSLSFDSPARDQSSVGWGAQGNAGWSTRVSNWGGRERRFLDSNRKGFDITPSGLVTVLDRHLIRPRFILSRRRVDVMVNIGF